MIFFKQKKKSIELRKEIEAGVDGIEECLIYIYEYLAEYFQNILFSK